MFKNKLRLLGMSTLVGAGLLASGPAGAYNMKLGDFDVQIDTTVSAGISWQMKDVESQYLPKSNGGPMETSTYGQANAATLAAALDPADGTGLYADEDEQTTALLTASILGGCAVAYATYCQEVVTRPSFAGSINTDDGRLNFDKGDPFSAPIRLTTEIEARSGPITAFARINVWHDIVAMDEDAFNRGGDLTNKGEDNAGQDIELLDAYVAYDGDIGDMPFTVKLGRQVINWGEATFIPGGNSSFNPIDVAALRRPGAEIKEALLPVEALYGSLAITQDLTVEAYVGGWDKYRLEAGGTFNQISDSFTDGTVSGNPQDVYFVGGGRRAGDQFACNGGSAANAGAGSVMTNSAEDHISLSSDIIDSFLAIQSIADACANNPNYDVLNAWTVGNSEAERVAAGDTNIVRGLSDEEGDDSFGIAVRYYAENLNSTEFAFYYQRGDSRLPYISYRTGAIGVKPTVTGYQGSTVGRGATAAGCAAMFGATGGLLYNPAQNLVSINDPNGLVAAQAPNVAQAIADHEANAVALETEQGDIFLDGYVVGTATPGSVAEMVETNCILTIGQTSSTNGFGSAFDGLGQTHTGATGLGAEWNMSLFAEFPEIETYGMSFNTTALGWGVQGDFTYRPDVPLQIDTDVLTIAALFNNCAFATVAGLEGVYQSGSTYNNEFGGVGCTDQNRYLRGYVDSHDAITWDIGTTATFTRSNPIVAALGSDLGIFLTEFQGVVVNDIEDVRGDTGNLNVPGGPAYRPGNAALSNVCVGGSDLPLAGILSIDSRTDGDVTTDADNNPQGHCRPTDSSYGMVLMAQLQYNNVFGTPIGLKPTVIYSHGIDGYSPSPIGFWREGQGSTAFSLNADYLGRWSGSLSYRAFHGDKDRTKNLDRDVLSMSVTYAY